MSNVVECQSSRLKLLARTNTLALSTIFNRMKLRDSPVCEACPYNACLDFTELSTLHKLLKFSLGTHLIILIKGNNKITELRTILQRESQNSKLYKHKTSQQPENCENRNDPDLVQAFLKKWWVESDFKVPNLPLSLRFKGSGCHYNSIYNNTGTK